jgi:hypothetical protein
MKVLVLEDDGSRISWFRQIFIGCSVDFAITTEFALAYLKDNDYTHIYLDHDLDENHYMLVFRGEEQHKYDHETGFAVAKFLADNPDKSKGAAITVHTLNEYAAKRMVRELHRGRRRYYRVPFTQLKFEGIKWPN